METIRTYATLCVCHDKMSVDEMIEVLGYEPSDSNQKGSQYKFSERSDPPTRLAGEANQRVERLVTSRLVKPVFIRSMKEEKQDSSLCRYSTENELDSTNFSEHLEFLISNLEGIYDKIKHHNQYGFEAFVSVFWASSFIGGSGPSLNVKHMKFLGDLGIDMQFNFWPEEESL